MSNLTDVVVTQRIRGATLALCAEFGEKGAGADLLAAALRRMGFDADKDDAASAARYLEGKGLLRSADLSSEALGIKRRLMWITPAGIDVLEGTAEVSGVTL